jgi:hypothetical protein
MQFYFFPFLYSVIIPDHFHIYQMVSPYDLPFILYVQSTTIRYFLFSA